MVQMGSTWSFWCFPILLLEAVFAIPVQNISNQYGDSFLDRRALAIPKLPKETLVPSKALLSGRSRSPEPNPNPRRDNLPTPGINDDLLPGLAEAGWHWSFTPGPVFMPVETSSAHLAVYFFRAMATVLAQMLMDNPIRNDIAIQDGQSPLILIVNVAQPGSGRGDAGALTWEFFYYILRFLRTRALRGFSGTGALWLSHRETLSYVRIILTLAPGVGEVVHHNCGAGSC